MCSLTGNLLLSLVPIDHWTMYSLHRFILRANYFKHDLFPPHEEVITVSGIESDFAVSPRGE